MAIGLRNVKNSSGCVERIGRLREEREILAKATAWFAREAGPGKSTGS